MTVARVLSHYSPDPAKPVLFYGGWGSNFVGGPLIITSLQPWSPDPVTYTYFTMEHYFQASKARDKEIHERIMRPEDPWHTKRLGNHCELRPDWELPYKGGSPVKYWVMVHGLRRKFRMQGFEEDLLATGSRWIAEDSPTDFVWGIRDEDGGFGGLNLLGQALMQVRLELQLNDRSWSLEMPPVLVDTPKSV